MGKGHHHHIQRTRWGIDATDAAQTSVLPPIKTPHVDFLFHHHAKAQEDELRTLTEAFQRHLELNRAALPSVGQLQEVLDQQQQQDQNEEEQEQEEEDEDEDEDDVAAAKKLVATFLPRFPGTSEFLLSLVCPLEDLIRVKIREESSKLASSDTFEPPSFGSPRKLNETRHVEPSTLHAVTSSSMAAASIAASEPHDGATSSLQTTPKRDARDDYFVKKNTFRETLRSRNFPPSRVPKHEYIVKTYSYTPLTKAARSDLSCVQLEPDDKQQDQDQDDEDPDPRQPWRVIKFPRPRPKLTPDQIQLFTQWMRTRLIQLDATHAATSKGADANKPTPTVVAQFRSEMELHEMLCYEMCRLVFDRCPTSARFLQGLYRELLAIAFQALDHAQKEAIVLQQRHKNVALEISRLQRTASNHHNALEQLKQLLRSHEQALGSAREKIIRKRKKINIFLASDQVIVRSLIKIVHTILEIIAGSTSGNEEAPNSSSSHLGANSDGFNSSTTTGSGDVSVHQIPQQHQQHHTLHIQKFSLIDELLEFVLTRYDNLKLIRAFRKKQQQAQRQQRIQNDRDRESDSSDSISASTNSGTKENVIILSSLDLKMAHRDFTSQTRRLDRLVSERCPDCTLGWHAQEVWDQALFIPPYEDIEDLEAEVAGFVQLVEKGIHIWQLDRSTRFRSVGTQTEDPVEAIGDENHSDELVPEKPSTTVPISWSPTRQLPAPPMLLEDDEDLELNEWLPRAPVGFRSFFSVASFPSDYAPVQYSIATVHNLISFLFNEIIKLVQEELDQGKDIWSDSGAGGLSSACVWYIYRVYMNHLLSPTFVNVCLMDLIVSLSRLDSQSCKIDLFCRLIQLNGVEKLPNEAFWFVIKALFALQRSTISNGGYFLLDDEQQNEFVPQASAWEAIQLIFGSHASNDMLKRLRTKLAGLANVYGTIWIPAYSILTILLDEWRLERTTIRETLETRMIGLMKREKKLTFVEFEALLEPLELKLSHLQMIHVYRDAICASASASASANATANGSNVDRRENTRTIEHVNRVFYQQSVKMILEQLATSQKSFHMMLVPIAEPLVAAQKELSCRFLHALWHQNKTTLIHRLDTKFPHEIGIRLRCVHQMENILETGNKSSAWYFFQQLVCLLY